MKTPARTLKSWFRVCRAVLDVSAGKAEVLYSSSDAKSEAFGGSGDSFAHFTLQSVSDALLSLHSTLLELAGQAVWRGSRRQERSADWQPRQLCWSASCSLALLTALLLLLLLLIRIRRAQRHRARVR